jgi:hypothetical protein
VRKEPWENAGRFEPVAAYNSRLDLRRKSPSTFSPKGFFLKKVGATGFEPTRDED